MRRTHPTAWPRPNGDTALSMLLVATLAAPLAAKLWGGAMPTPLGVSRLVLAIAVAAIGAGHIAWRWRRAGARGALVAAVVVALTVPLAMLIAHLIELRASAFYTEAALFEGVLLLLGMHAIAGALRIVARHAAPARTARHGVVRTFWRRQRDGTPVTTAGFANFVADGVAMLVAGSWALVALGIREPAFVLLLAAGATELLVIVLRIPDAARAVQRWMMPLALLAVATLGFAALARGQATPASPSSLRLDIPAYRLDLIVDGAVVASYDVAVGMRRYRTPTGDFAIERIVWNPWWVPPKSPWARKEKVTPPGPDNPMGRVKLLLGGPYYLHGTPFVSSMRSAASHGCIRMRDADAMALARTLQAQAGVALDSVAIAAILADTMSVIVDLPGPVPVTIAYAVAELRGDTLLLHPDVYRLLAGRTHEAAMLALVDGGRDTLLVRRRVLASALKRARSRHVAIPLDSLLDRDTATTPVIVRTP